VNNLLDEEKEILVWDSKGVTQKLGKLHPVTVYLPKIVTHEVFFAIIVIPTIVLVIFQMEEFNTIFGLDFISFRFGLFIGVIYILLLAINLVVMFFIYKKDIWLYQDGKKESNSKVKVKDINMTIPEGVQTEYRELCAYHRHQRGLTWQMGSILITASLAIFGIVASRHDDLPLSVLIPSGFVSIFTLTLFWLVFERMSFLNDALKARMKEIEKEFGMCIIRAYTKKDSEYKGRTNHPTGRELRTTWLVRGLIIVYIFGWIFLWIFK